MMGRRLPVLFLVFQCNCQAIEILEPSYNKEADFMIGGIIPEHNGMHHNDATRKNQCWQPSFLLIKHALAFIYAIEEINRNPNILPNITLGYAIYDSCGVPGTALHGILNILSKCTVPFPNFRCQMISECRRKDTLIGFVGDLLTPASYVMAQILGLYKYPQISFGSQDSRFSDKTAFPTFYRTVSNEFPQYTGIAKLLEHFKWTWVGILTTDDDSGEQALRVLTREIAQIGSCIEFSRVIPNVDDSISFHKTQTILEATRSSTARVIIFLYVSGADRMLFKFYLSDTGANKIWITSMTLSFVANYANDINLRKMNGTLAFLMKKTEIVGFKDFLINVNAATYADNRAIFNLLQRCYINKARSVHCLYTKMPNVTLSRLDSSVFDVENLWFSHSVYTAVYALAHALHEMLLSDPSLGTERAAGRLRNEYKPWKLNRFLQKIHCKTPAGDDFAFDDKGEVPAEYDIFNWIYLPNKTVRSIHIGTYDPSASPSNQLVINEGAVLLPFQETHPDKTPESKCSESCQPGYRKVPIEGKPICCYSCVACAEGEFANSTDMENCLMCPEDQYVNNKKDGCFDKSITFLSYSGMLGGSLTTIVVVFTITTAGVLGLFLRHKHTPIVKANNRDLSYGILVSLMLSFLCSLLFIGRPVAWTCLIRQAAFGIIFTVAVSCVLAKTITVIIAFNATRPGSRLGRWLGPKMSWSVVFLCTLGETLICLFWLLTSPPYPNADKSSEAQEIILQCDEGSAAAFYAVLGYVGMLAFVSFFIAFQARNLPDRFNEAQLITFSMLVFCSVWASFIPAYISTKGTYMVAVEIFAILASSAGLLSCIFFPKCYIILCRPELNRRGMMEKK